MLTRAMAAAAGLVVVAIAAPAWAETAVVRSAVNVRAGPGPEHRIVGVLAQGRRIEIVACTQSRRWCQVTTENGPGWIYTSYVSWSGGADVAVVQNPGLAPANPPPQQVQPTQPDAVPTVAQPQADVAGTPPAAAPAPDQARPASPGVVIPPDTVRSFVVTRPVDPVYLEGTVVVGAGLPEVVPLYPVPDYEYRYAFVNDQRVLVDGDRRIVYVFR
jgi:hypothetical protein